MAKLESSLAVNWCFKMSSYFLFAIPRLRATSRNNFRAFDGALDRYRHRFCELINHIMLLPFGTTLAATLFNN